MSLSANRALCPGHRDAFRQVPPRHHADVIAAKHPRPTSRQDRQYRQRVDEKLAPRCCDEVSVEVGGHPLDCQNIGERSRGWRVG
jgi:hypothetical protein